MDARAVLADLVEGRPLDADAARWFANAIATGQASDAQVGAFAMAVRLKRLDPSTRSALTMAMRDSGSVLRWDLPGPVLDKHSTGGLGDCVSLVLAPALACCGAFVPMISGRGLGHTGGTLDKLEAIPGLRTGLSEDELRKTVGEVGCAIVSASAAIAPADRRLYAVRDVTSTVSSLDLIVASILSKKLAAGLDGLVLDVKAGSGAFMSTREAATALAAALVETANAAGCRTAALITDMNQPLAPALGNALEVAEVMAVLSGDRQGPLLDLTVAMGGELLALGGLAGDAAAGRQLVSEAIGSGEAMERFGRMVAVQGGPTEFTTAWASQLPRAPLVREVPATASGVVTAMDGRALGMAVVRLGGGRLREGDAVDPSVGLSNVVRLGSRVEPGAELARIHAADEASADRAERSVRNAVEIAGGEAFAPPPLVLGAITAAGERPI